MYGAAMKTNVDTFSDQYFKITIVLIIMHIALIS